MVPLAGWGQARCEVFRCADEGRVRVKQKNVALNSAQGGVRIDAL
jgi:hypothetical protein